MISRLARRYARALLGIAREANALEAAGNDLATVDAALADPRLQALLSSPLIDVRKRVEIVTKVVEALGVSTTVRNLARLLAERDRLAIVPDIERSYSAMIDAALGRMRARIRTATPLGSAEQHEVSELAKRLSGGREVVVTLDVDPALLGGVVLDIGGTVYDGSLRAQLDRLGRNMAGGGA